MIVKEKVLLEFDVPTISGYTYPHELMVDMMKKINNESIGGVIYFDNEPPKEFSNSNKFRIINPKAIVDDTITPAELLLICDIDFHNLTEEEEELLAENSWRLSAVGYAEYDDKNKIVEKYDLQYINIEIISQV